MLREKATHKKSNSLKKKLDPTPKCIKGKKTKKKVVSFQLKHLRHKLQGRKLHFQTNLVVFFSINESFLEIKAKRSPQKH